MKCRQGHRKIKEQLTSQANRCTGVKCGTLKSRENLKIFLKITSLAQAEMTKQLQRFMSNHGKDPASRNLFAALLSLWGSKACCLIAVILEKLAASSPPPTRSPDEP